MGARSSIWVAVRILETWIGMRGCLRPDQRTLSMPRMSSKSVVTIRTDLSLIADRDVELPEGIYLHQLSMVALLGQGVHVVWSAQAEIQCFANMGFRPLQVLIISSTWVSTDRGISDCARDPEKYCSLVFTCTYSGAHAYSECSSEASQWWFHCSLNRTMHVRELN